MALMTLFGPLYSPTLQLQGILGASAWLAKMQGSWQKAATGF